MDATALRLSLVGEERDAVVRTVTAAIEALRRRDTSGVRQEKRWSHADLSAWSYMSVKATFIGD